MKGKNLGFPAGQPGRVPCRQGNVAQLLLDVSVVRAVGELVGPLRRLVALNVLLGRSLWTLVQDLCRALWGALGWAWAPPRDPVLRSLGQRVFVVRRWHYGLGAAPPFCHPCSPTCHPAPAGLTSFLWPCSRPGAHLCPPESPPASQGGVGRGVPGAEAAAAADGAG